MASITKNVIEQVKIGSGNAAAIASTAYGECATAAATAQKDVEMSGFKLVTGVTIHVKFTYANTNSSPTLKVGDETAKEIDYYSGGGIPYWSAGAILEFTYDGSKWRINNPNQGRIITINHTGGTNTAAVTTSPYKPMIWKFDAKITATDGMIISITTPGAGHSNGVFLSVNNGTNYYPIVANGTGRVTTHYPTGSQLLLAFDSDGSAASIYPLAGAAATTTVTGGVWRVINYYDSGNSNTDRSGIGICSTAAGTAAKTVTFPNFALATNSSIIIKVDTANTAQSALTLNVNSTGAKTIYVNGTVTSTSSYSLPAGYYWAQYDGTYWKLTTLKFTDTTYSAATTSAAGLMSAADKTKLDGIATSANAYSHPTGDGNKHVPATSTTNNGKFLTAGSTAGALSWTTPPTVTTSAAGYMSAADKTKLDGIATGANAYSHPTGDGNKHVPATSTTNNGKFLTAGSTAGSLSWTTPPAATTSAAGYMSAADKTKLDGIAAGANAYTHPTSAGNKHIPSGGASGNILRWSASGTAVWGDDNDTKNTAGSNNSTSKLFLIGATSQGNNPTTNSNEKVYTTAGQLDATKFRVAEKVTLQYNSTTESLSFVFG